MLDYMRELAEYLKVSLPNDVVPLRPVHTRRKLCAQIIKVQKILFRYVMMMRTHRYLYAG
jgi:hypothetical protein